MTGDLDDVTVVISISAAVARVPLTKWMEMGPGRRHAVRPESPRSRSTGEDLPPAAIPLPYRNDAESRALIAAGRIPSPWRHKPWNVEEWGPRPGEVFGPRPFDGSSLDGIGAVLCELLESDARPRDVAQVGAVIDALGVLRHDPAVDLLYSLIGQSVHAYRDLELAHRCLRALSAIGTRQARYRLLTVSLGGAWPPPIPAWTAEELKTFDV